MHILLLLLLLYFKNNLKIISEEMSHLMKINSNTSLHILSLIFCREEEKRKRKISSIIW